METVEHLDDNLIDQLAAMYEKTWFAKNRHVDDIRMMLKNCYLTLGYVKSGELLSFCRVISDGVYKAFLFDVIVKEEYQNKGLGRRMIDELLHHNRLSHIPHIELYCPEEMTPFYRKLGFDTRTSLLMRYAKE